MSATTRGWLLMGCGLTGSLQLVTGQYAVLDGPVGLPGRLHAVLIASQFQISWVGLVLLLLLLFPTGRLPSPRWRPMAWSVVAGDRPRPRDSGAQAEDPLGYFRGHDPFALPARYDAVRTVETFSVRLRDEVDLDTLSAELLAVVDQTVQPTQASLWLRPTSMKSPPKAQPSNRANVA